MTTQLFTAQDVAVGCRAHVKHGGEFRLAEVLAVQTKKGRLVFYIHYVEFNKRLDEWVEADRFDYSRPLELPAPETPKKDSKKDSKKAVKDEPGATPIPKRGQKQTGPDNDSMMDLDNLNVQGLVPEGEELLREEEIKKLRTGGLMAQNHSLEVAKVRNILKIIIGNHEVEPWYFSPYPVELTEEDQLYVCDFTMEYFGLRKQFERFRSKCTLRHPPGNEIYRDDVVLFFEIDGRKQRTWCRNLCLLSKLFLDHKTLYYDVDPFLFYCMTKRDELGHHLVGYFSKEKELMEGYNVACILTLPQYQRHGYGKLLIQFLYMLSRVEKKFGLPEKPLSDLGLLSYRAYWADAIIKLLVESGLDISVDDIGAHTSMTQADVLHTLQTLNMLRYYRGQHVLVLTDQALEQYNKVKSKNKHVLDPDLLVWTPPVFTSAQLRFGW